MAVRGVARGVAILSVTAPASPCWGRRPARIGRGPVRPMRIARTVLESGGASGEFARRGALRNFARDPCGLAGSRVENPFKLDQRRPDTHGSLRRVLSEIDSTGRFCS